MSVFALLFLSLRFDVFVVGVVICSVLCLVLAQSRCLIVVCCCVLVCCVLLHCLLFVLSVLSIVCACCMCYCAFCGILSSIMFIVVLCFVYILVFVDCAVLALL